MLVIMIRLTLVFFTIRVRIWITITVMLSVWVKIMLLCIGFMLDLRVDVLFGLGLRYRKIQD